MWRLNLKIENGNNESITLPGHRRKIPKTISNLTHVS